MTAAKFEPLIFSVWVKFRVTLNIIYDYLDSELARLKVPVQTETQTGIYLLVGIRTQDPSVKAI
jgi:hypothetical protein